MPEVMSIEVDEEFDPRPPQTPFGLRGPDGKLNIPLIAGVAFAIVLVLLLIFVVVKPFSKEAAPPPVSNWKPNNPVENIQAIPVYPANSALVISLQESLDSYAKFYTTGDLEEIQKTFDLAGPQYALIAKEQPTVIANPDPGEPAVIDLGAVGKVTQNDKLYTVRTTVTWTKPGGTPNEFQWDIIMKQRTGNDYVLNRIDETQEGAKQPIDFCGAIGFISELDSDDVVTKELGEFSGDKYVAKVREIAEIREDTWSFLQEVAAGTDDQEAVDAIMGEWAALIDASKSDDDPIKAIEQVTKDINNEKNYERVVSRAEDQCGISLAL